MEDGLLPVPVVDERLGPVDGHLLGGRLLGRAHSVVRLGTGLGALSGVGHGKRT